MILLYFAGGKCFYQLYDFFLEQEKKYIENVQLSDNKVIIFSQFEGGNV